MTLNRAMLLRILNGAMELSWLGALVLFSTRLLGGRPFPLTEGAGIFVLAALLTHCITARGWRIASVLGLQLFFLLFASSRIIYLVYDGTSPFLSSDWLLAFFAAPRSHPEWINLIACLFWTGIFYGGGITLARRRMAYYTLCQRFDIGLAAFFLLFLTKFLLIYKAQMKVDDPVSILFFFPFFLLGLLCIGTVRTEGNASKETLPGHKVGAVLLSFAGGLILCTAGLISFFLPLLTVAAETSYWALRTTGRPVGSLFVALVRLLYGPRGVRPEPSGQGHGFNWGLIRPWESTWWLALLEKIVGWGMMGIMLLLLLALLGLALFYLIRWLLTATSTEKRGIVVRRPFFWWLPRARAFLISFSQRIGLSIRGHRRASELYASLLGWSRRSGLSHAQDETPAEFGARLQDRFPGLGGEIEVIVNAFNQEVYGEMVLSDSRLNSARSAWRVLRSPLRWPSRLKGLFFRTPVNGDIA
jgi:hypothetical protein